MHKCANPPEIQNKLYVTTNGFKLHPDDIRFCREYHSADIDWVVSSKYWHLMFGEKYHVTDIKIIHSRFSQMIWKEIRTLKNVSSPSAHTNVL